MYELVQAGEKSYYIDCPSKIGVYLADGNNAYLIDSGNSKDTGKKVRKILDGQGWALRGIINTHSHADHIGGNKYLQEQTGCKVFAGGIEGAFTQYPVLEPSFVYGGYPCGDLRHKFLMAGESNVSGLDDPDFPSELKVIPLPGHTFDMVGILTPDGTAFVADCVSSPETLEKYQVSFIYDVAAYLETLDKVEHMEAKLFIPAHAQPCTDMSSLAEVNRQKVHEIEGKILELLTGPVCFDELLKAIFDSYGLAMSFEQHCLVGSTLRSYLSWLRDRGLIEPDFTGNMLSWRRI